MRLFVFLAAAVLASAPVLAAQSLADVAKKEGERRQTVKGSGKTYTNKDLKAVPAPAPAPDAGVDASGGGATSAPAGDAAHPAAPASSAGDQKPGADAKAAEDQTKGEVRDQAYWRKRIDGLREQLDRDQTYAAALQSRIDALTTDFVNRDDPAQRDQVAFDRQKAVTELDRLKKNIELDRREIADTEEEARRAGVPPGWLR